VLIEQAIFTSAERDHAVGYHLVARSPGVEECDARELTVWGPSHESLASTRESAASVNFFPLPSGAYCISRTQLAGEEYSGRGLRTYTHCLVVPPQVLVRFANNPFALLRAASAKGLMTVCNTVPQQMAPFQLAGRSAVVDEGLIAELAEEIGPDRIRQIVTAVLGTKPVVLLCPTRPEAAVALVLNLLPLGVRTELSFSTGLKYSARRSFRLLVSPEPSAELRRLSRQHVIEVVNLSSTAEKRSQPNKAVSDASESNGWAQYIADSIEHDSLAQVCRQIDIQRDGVSLANLNALGKRLLQGIDAKDSGVPAAAERWSRRRARADAAAPSARVQTPDEGSATDDDFLALLASGRVQQAAARDRAATENNGPDRETMRRPHAPPSHLLACDSPDILAQLELLDDAVFEAMSGNADALEDVERLWPKLVAELGAEKLEESREQYLRYSLSTWERFLETGFAQPERAVAALHVLSVVFGRP
jgi:hypothetical protein